MPRFLPPPPPPTHPHTPSCSTHLAARPGRLRGPSLPRLPAGEEQREAADRAVPGAGGSGRRGGTPAPCAPPAQRLHCPCTSPGRQRRGVLETAHSIADPHPPPPHLSSSPPLQRCLVWEPEQRMTPDQALQHPWVTGGVLRGGGPRSWQFGCSRRCTGGRLAIRLCSRSRVLASRLFLNVLVITRETLAGRLMLQLLSAAPPQPCPCLQEVRLRRSCRAAATWPAAWAAPSLRPGQPLEGAAARSLAPAPAWPPSPAAC